MGGQESVSALAHYGLERGEGRQVRLPRALNEISGLVVHGDRVYAHNDERGVVYAIDPASGATEVAFAPGDRGLRGDFEGLAVAGDRMFLITSDGVLVAFRMRVGGEGIPYETYDGLAARNCEVEGLEYDEVTRSLLLACKSTRGRALDDRLVVFAWSLERRQADPEPRWAVTLDELARVGGGRRLHPSGLAIHPLSGTLFIVAGRQKLIVEMARSGRILGARALPGRDHAQPEGIAFLPDGTLLIADEGAGGRGTLTSYPYRPGR